MKFIFASCACSIKNNRETKPNEDFYKADDRLGIYLLADGITSTPGADELYPSPSGGEMVARLFCDTVYRQLYQLTDGIASEKIRQAVLFANQEIYALNTVHHRYEMANFLNIDYFGCVGTVLVATEVGFQILHIGDTMVLLARKNHLQLLTENQTKNVADYKNKVRNRPDFSARDLTIAIRRDFRNNIDASGLDGERVGYGAFTGQAGVADFIREDDICLQDGDVVLMLSDGFEPLVSNTLSNLQASQELINRLGDGDTFFRWLLSENARFETSSDDKTAIIIHVFG